MRVLLLSRYSRLGASSRVRSLQYLPFLESKGWTIDVNPLFSDRYLRALYSGKSRIVQVLIGYWRRLYYIFKARKYDLIWIEKEIFPFMPAFIEYLFAKSGIRYVVDYDDALFHRYDKNSYWLIRFILGNKIDLVMKHASLVIVGNDYLAERARMASAQCVEIIPTVVDLNHYEVTPSVNKQPLVVGWIGSPSTIHYISILTPLIESLLNEFDVQFVMVGVCKELVSDLPVEVKPWSEDTEVSLIQSFDIGIMPLVDGFWERGKCAYKIIQYMACGLPVVASSVGVNKQVVSHGANGFLANDLSEWEQSLRCLLSDKNLRTRMGNKGRKYVEANYSLQVQASCLERLLHRVLK